MCDITSDNYIDINDDGEEIRVLEVTFICDRCRRFILLDDLDLIKQAFDLGYWMKDSVHLCGECIEEIEARDAKNA